MNTMVQEHAIYTSERAMPQPITFMAPCEFSTFA